jgi:uncharacterized protein with beta-barrel porin domain
MRLRGFHLAGLAAALAGAGAAGEAQAADLNVNSATTTPVVTSNANGGAGNVTVASGGSITVTAGQTAVTIDSNNNVSNAGTLTSNDANNTTGIHGLGGNSGSITNTGTMSLVESYVLTDTDSDGDLDGAFATGLNRNGILIDGPGTFTGNVNNSGSITIEGNSSAAIRLDSLLTGNLSSSGGINITGDNSAAVLINGGVTGDVLVRNSIGVRGQGSSGLVVNGAINGQLRVNGGWTVTGFHSTTLPTDQSTLEPDDLLIGGAAIAIHADVDGGVTIEGVGVEDDPDDDGDGTTEAAGDTDDDVSANIVSVGSAPALLISSLPSTNLVIGPIASGTGAGYGVHLRGSLTSTGVFNGVSATTILLQGAAGATVQTQAGMILDGAVLTSAVQADAYSVRVGGYASVPTILVRRSLATNVGSDGANTAYSFYFDPNATVNTLSNSSTITTHLFGETGNAVSIADHSNTLGTINNSGTIEATVIATDADPTDALPPPPITGRSIAIDVSTSTIDVTVNQVALTPFTDDDAVDDDLNSAPPIRITGDILFGAGADNLNLMTGQITGNISFGAGADEFNINNGGLYFGRVDDSDGDLHVDIINGTLALNGGTLNMSDMHVGADGQLGVVLSETPSETTVINVSGAVTFDPGAVLIPIVPTGLPNSGTHTFLTAGSIVGGANITGPITADGVPYLYNLSIDQVGNTLEAGYILKSAAQLGLNRNQSIAFNPIIEAARLDDNLSAALATLDNQSDFFDAYQDLMPTYSSAATELATTAIQQMQSATTNRLNTTRINGVHDVSAWAQEIGYALNRSPEDANGQEFRGHGFGLAGGIDGPLDNGAMFGLSASFISSEMEEPGRPEGEISASFGQFNAYLGTAVGPIDLDFVGGLGVGKMSERRFVEVGTFTARTDADWWSYEGHGAIRASAPMRVANWLIVSPQLALTYVGLQEDGYTEDGGGAGVDYEADEQFSQRLWADAGIDFAARFQMRGQSVVQPHIYAGYRANTLDDSSERTFRFVSTGTEFTLADDPIGSGGPLIGIGIDATNGYSTFSIAYEGEFGEQIDRHSLNAAIRFRF